MLRATSLVLSTNGLEQGIQCSPSLISHHFINIHRQHRTRKPIYKASNVPHLSSVHPLPSTTPTRPMPYAKSRGVLSMRNHIAVYIQPFMKKFHVTSNRTSAFASSSISCEVELQPNRNRLRDASPSCSHTSITRHQLKLIFLMTNLRLPRTRLLENTKRPI